jgi:biopolymer transport protein ExbD
MAFTPRRRRSLDQIPLNLASMIDVTFLLLIYFMVSTVLAPDERTLDTAIRQEKEGAASDARDFRPQRILVQADAEGPVWMVGRRPIRARAELERVVGDLPTEAGMVIEVADGVPVDAAVAALQVARDAGFAEVSYVPSR